MNLTSFGLILTGVLLNAAAQLFLKGGTTATGEISLTRDNWLQLGWTIATNPSFIAGFACYGISVLIWIAALSRVPVSVAYPMLSIGYVVNAIAAYLLFGEVLSIAKWAGITFIIIGVWLVAKS